MKNKKKNNFHSCPMWRQKWETGEYQWTGAYEDGANDENDDDNDDDNADDDDDNDDTKGITLDN